jgi:hypothetical protein
MHAGKIATSKRLQATLEAIKGGWRTTLDISHATGSMAVHSDIAALRAQGIRVDARYAGMSPEPGKNRIWEYRATQQQEQGGV